MDQQEHNVRTKPAPQQTQVSGGTHTKDIQPPLEPKADEEARTGRSGEGDRTDTEEMRQLSKE